jgi:PPE-repeat protein
MVKTIKNSMIDVEDINQHDEEGSCTSENEINVSQSSTPARRLSNVETLKNTQNNQGSFVWNHFIRDTNFKDNKKATCNYCNKTYVCTGSSTTNLSKHLRNVHSIQQGVQPTRNIIEMLKAPKVYILFYFLFFSILISFIYYICTYYLVVI